MALTQALEQADRLLTLLDAEFEALKNQDIPLFESFQQEKMAILQYLGSIASPEGADEASWSSFLDRVKDCRDRHRRNQILIQRKLDAIRGALKTLEGAEAASSVEVYDKMGRLSAGRRGRGLADA